MRGKRCRRTWRVIGRRPGGSEAPIRSERLTRAEALKKAGRLNEVSKDFWWAMHSLSYEPQAYSRRPIYDGKLSRLSHRRFWG